MKNSSKEEKREYLQSMCMTILKSFLCSVDYWTICSWGMDKKVGIWFRDMPSLRCQVNGMLHKGTLIVSYDEGSDLFNMYLLDKDGQVIKETEGIYFDDLGRIVDESIERPKGMSDDEYRAATFKAAVAAAG